MVLSIASATTAFLVVNCWRNAVRLLSVNTNSVRTAVVLHVCMCRARAAYIAALTVAVAIAASAAAAAAAAAA
jgi:hypothetical protein